MKQATANKTWIDKEFTHKDEGAEKNKHVINFLTYQTNNRISFLNANDGSSLFNDRNSHINIYETLQDDKTFTIPLIKKYHPFDYKNYFTKSTNWIGYVTAISDKGFSAKIEETNQLGGTYEDAEFDLDEVDEEDKVLLSIGSIFYWSVGIELRNGSRIKESLLRFKRSPKWSVSDIDEAKDLSDDLYKNLIWD